MTNGRGMTRKKKGGVNDNKTGRDEKFVKRRDFVTSYTHYAL